MACKPCQKRREARDAKTIQPLGQRGAPPEKPCCPDVDKGECPHGVRPWWDCAPCASDKTYSFKGNFR